MKAKPSPAAASAELRARDELLARAGHDLRTPLGSLVTWLHVLSRDPAGPQSATALDMLARSSRDLGQLLNGLDDARQLMTGTLELQRLPLDLQATLARSLERAAAVAEARGLALELGPPGSARVLGDAARLERALGRLLLHVATLTDPSGALRVRLVCAGREAHVSLACKGLQLSAQLTEALGDRDAWPSLSGPGGQAALDFAVASRLALLHGGDVRLASDGRGGSETQIRVALPLEPDSPAQPTT